MIILSTIAAGSAAYITGSVRSQRRHLRRMRQTFQHRIHVNGIRGKSSVTRLIAASMREGGIRTLAKTTGTAARVITSNRREQPVARKEANIGEQKRILDEYLDKGYQAVVFECMAINPLYQAYLEDKIMQSTIGVITNVREDHVDLLGETLPEIARSLCNTVPRGGHLVTAETDPELLAVMAEVCRQRGSQLHAVGDMNIADKHMAKFKHFEYKDNVAIAIKVAQLAGIGRQTALAGMWKALPDPGAFVLKEFKQPERTIHWANLFAINDRESFISTTETLSGKLGSGTGTAVILNNRHDRPERVAQFVDIAVNAVEADYIITFGDYEKQVASEINKHVKNAKSTNHAAKPVELVRLGNSTKHKNASGKKLLQLITDSLRGKGKEYLLVGAVNIHTAQSQELLGVLEKGNRIYAH